MVKKILEVMAEVPLIATSWALNVLGDITSEKINLDSHEGLKAIVDEEVAKLGFEPDKRIAPRFGYADQGTYVRDMDNHYRLTIGEDEKNMSSVRHEVYHLFKGDLKEDRLLKGVQEVKASIYGVFKIKL